MAAPLAGRARTSVPSGLSTLERTAAVAARTVQAIPDAVTIEGGFPVAMDGTTVGALAVSGADPLQDAIVAGAGLAALRNY